MHTAVPGATRRGPRRKPPRCRGQRPDPKDPDEVATRWVPFPPVATEYKRGLAKPATTAQNPMGTMVPANPPNLAHRRCINQAATSTAAAMIRP